jgi:hypothetical protein
LVGDSLRCIAELCVAPLLTFNPNGGFRESHPAGRDWVRSLDCSICLIQSGRSRHGLAVFRLAMKSMDRAATLGRQVAFVAGGFRAS